MKLQYLGDAKDAFKWDYLDFLAREMRMGLYIVPMLTPDDRASHLVFPASDGVLGFCCSVRNRENRKLKSLRKLPKFTNSGRVAKFARWLRNISLACIRGDYQVELHNPSVTFSESERDGYFDNMPSGEKHILFFDPDTGFEPQTADEGHVKYSGIQAVWKQIAKDAIVVVFQHARRRHLPFLEHHEEIRRRLSGIGKLYSTALFWRNNEMLVILGKSLSKIEEVRKANIKYQQQPRPVQIIGGKK